MTRNTIFLFHILFSFCFFLNEPLVFSQKSRVVDSLRVSLTRELDDSVRVNVLSRLGWELSFNDLHKGLDYCIQAKGLAERIQYNKGLATVLSRIGNIYTDLGDYPKAMEAYLMQIEIVKELGVKLSLGAVYADISKVYYGLKNYKKSKEYIDLAVTTYLRSYNEAVVGDFPDPASRDTYLNSIKKHLAFAYNSISEAFSDKNESDSAMAYIYKSLRLNEELHDNPQLAINYQNLGKIYLDQLKEYDKAERYFKKAKKYFGIINDSDLSVVHLFIGKALFLQERYDEAAFTTLQALRLARKVGMKDIIKNAYSQMSSICEAKGDLENGLAYHKKYADIKDTILLENQKVQLNLAQSRVENERKNIEIELLEQKNKLNKAETSRQRTVIYSVIALLLVATLIVYILFLRNKERHRAYRLLSLQKNEILIQKDIVEYQNKRIKDSINYARRIQDVILPEPEDISRNLKDSFIFYEPKDVVSGDFYWLANREGRIYLAAIDCTGHGVPGAFMSMIGYTLLNEIVNNENIVFPSDILNELRSGIIKSLKQRDMESENKDGMDIALCLLHEKKLYFSGAFNPLVLIRDNKLIEYKADRQPIGIYIGQANPFTNHVIELREGDVFYIFTDGYADQFGGPHGRRFKNSELNGLLLKIHQEEMNTQKELLAKHFNEWKGDSEQIDDVLLIGVKV